MNIKKNLIFTLGMLLVAGLGASFYLFVPLSKVKTYYLAVIPHFMIQPQKVSDFYAFLKEKYFLHTDPDRIVLLSPNHFFVHQKRVEGICQKESIRFKDQKITATPLLDDRIDCGAQEFYYRGNQKYTKDHGLGEHFRWINLYFPKVKEVIILALPSHGMLNAERLTEEILKFKGNTFVIGSVDFSHYLSESIAEKNDQISFSTLSDSGAFSRLKKLDVDCPACLGVLYRLAEKQKIHPHQWWRDSSSTIVGYDLKEENTSRQFIWRE